jgi:hypothetical protein
VKKFMGLFWLRGQTAIIDATTLLRPVDKRHIKARLKEDPNFEACRRISPKPTLQMNK